MKKAFAIMALIAAMFVAGNMQAQTSLYATYAPETFVAHFNNDNKTDYQGFSIGFNHNFGLYKGLRVATGAQFRMNKKIYENTVLGLTGKVKNTQVLIDVPILFNYSFDLTPFLSVAPFVGPMASFGITGVTKSSDPIVGESSYSWYGDNGNMKRFNLYAVFGADVIFNSFNLFGGYRLGLLDVDKYDQTTTKTKGFFVGIGITF